MRHGAQKMLGAPNLLLMTHIAISGRKLAVLLVGVLDWALGIETTPANPAAAAHTSYAQPSSVAASTHGDRAYAP